MAGASSDKLHQRSKRNRNTDLKRRAASRDPKQRILIVTEGEVTEISYFKALKHRLAATNVDVEIIPGDGSAPSSILSTAKEKVAREGTGNAGYDKVYCVFDRDQHDSFRDVVDKIRRIPTSKKPVYRHICSIPCIEYWFLLHFEKTTKPFVGSGKNNPCTVVTNNLKRKLKSYSLAYSKQIGQSVLDLLLDRTAKAMQNAQAVWEEQKACTTPEAFANFTNPITEMHFLIEDLQKSAK